MQLAGCIMKMIKIWTLSLGIMGFVSYAIAEGKVEVSEQLLTPERIDNAVEFFAIAKIGTSPEFTVEYSKKRGGPEGNTYRFWGLTITDYDATRVFLEGRVLKCMIVYSANNIGSVDCVAAPQKGEKQLLAGSAKGWLDLFTWLPELGLAKHECSESDLLKRIHFKEPVRAYLCRKLFSNSNGNPDTLIIGDEMVPVRGELGPPTSQY